MLCRNTMPITHHTSLSVVFCQTKNSRRGRISFSFASNISLAIYEGVIWVCFVITTNIVRSWVTLRRQWWVQLIFCSCSKVSVCNHDNLWVAQFFPQAQSSPILAPMQCICCVWIFSAESSAAQWLTSALSGHLARASEAGVVSGW